MAGTVLDGQLNPRGMGVPPTSGDTGETPVPRSRVRYAVATLADEPALRRLLRDNPMRGAISLSFEREPHYFAGAHLAEADDTTIIAHEGSRLVCMGRCITRTCWLNGAPRRVSYLGELRLDVTAQGRFDILRGGYRFFHELHRRAPADFTFTSVAADNERARRLLERGIPGLPRYEFLSEFVTLLIPVSRSARLRAPRAQARCPTADELVAFLNTHAERHQLAAVWTQEKLASLEHHGLSLDDFAFIRSDDGRLLAVAALWDQQPFRQTVIRGYSPALAYARPAMNLAARLFGTPHLPPPGTVLAHAFLSPLALALDATDRLPDLVAELSARAARGGLEFLTLGFAANDPRLALLRARYRCRSYVSRIYRVIWPHDRDPLSLDPRPLLPEIAFL